MAKGKTIEDAAAEAQGLPTTLEQRLEQLLERDARREAEMEALRARLDELTGRAAPEAPTLIPEDYKAWAALSAQEKTQLVADRLYGPAEGLRPFDVQLVYHPRRGATGKEEPRHSEQPRVRLFARGDAEAGALYQSLCGISGYSAEEARLEVVAA